ncbi:MAG TPA: hypothetical protein VHP13_00240 [Gammaproteobacteria bacterium]|jgi:hypothetical protein|nr:hypothetical protein [Gammaproteobacteria bacterium]
MKRVLFLSLLIALAACGKTPDKVVAVDASQSADVQALVKDATKQLVTACTGLNQYSYDLLKKTWTASVANNAGNSFNYRTEKWGWNKWVEIQVQVSPKAKDLPKEWEAQGKILVYDLGGGKTPGIASRDKLSQRMCGSMAISNDPEDPYSYLGWPDLVSLDKLP